jgi:hypothetical protein
MINQDAARDVRDSDATLTELLLLYFWPVVHDQRRGRVARDYVEDSSLAQPANGEVTNGS